MEYPLPQTQYMPTAPAIQPNSSHYASAPSASYQPTNIATPITLQPNFISSQQPTIDHLIGTQQPSKLKLISIFLFISGKVKMFFFCQID